MNDQSDLVGAFLERTIKVVERQGLPPDFSPRLDTIQETRGIFLVVFFENRLRNNTVVSENRNKRGSIEGEKCLAR